jgi:D-3-phosphoglycerate dehydrogenase / 2-oxoglutarate reductase
MRVLVADKFEKSGLDGLAAIGCEIVSQPDLAGEALRDAVRELSPRVLVVRSTKVEADAIQTSSLGLIVRAGAGYNTIDVDAASESGVWVSNCPGKNAQAVAELAFGLILAVDRKIPDNVTEFRSGRWNKKGFAKARGLHGSTLGLVGMGMIGKEMVARAKAFGMPVVAFSRHMSAADAAALGIELASSLTDLAARSDVVSVHCSLTPETRGSLDAAFFAAMRPGAVFVNTSRAEVVVEEALLESLRSGRIWAGLDFFDSEPSGGDGEVSSPLAALSNAYVTHHIGASTDQAQEAVAAETVRIVQVFMATGTPPNAVNHPVVTA